MHVYGDIVSIKKNQADGRILVNCLSGNGIQTYEVTEEIIYDLVDYKDRVDWVYDILNAHVFISSELKEVKEAGKLPEKYFKQLYKFIHSFPFSWTKKPEGYYAVSCSPDDLLVNAETTLVDESNGWCLLKITKSDNSKLIDTYVLLTDYGKVFLLGKSSDEYGSLDVSINSAGRCSIYDNSISLKSSSGKTLKRFGVKYLDNSVDFIDLVQVAKRINK